MSVRGVFKHALIFGLAPVLQKLISALLLPFFTHYLTEPEYGLRDLLVAITGLFPVLFAFEYRVALIKRMVEIENDSADIKRRLFTSSMILMFLLSIAAALVFFTSWPLILAAFPTAAVPVTFRVILSAGILLDIVMFVLLATAQAQLESARIVKINLIQFTTGVLLNITFVVGCAMGPMGLFLGNAIASFLAVLLLLWTHARMFRRPTSLREIADDCTPLIKYSLPLWCGALTYFVLQNVDRFVLSSSLAALGIYGMARKLSNYLLLMVLVPFQRSFDVWRFKVFEQKEDPRVMADVFRWFLLVASFLSLGLATVGGDLFTVLAHERYIGALDYLPWLNAALLLQCAYCVSNSAFYVTNKTGLWVRLFVVATLLQSLLCWLAVEAVGPSAIPFALIIANGFLYAASILYGRTLWRVPYPHVLAVALFAVTTGLAWTRRQLHVAPPWSFVIDLSLLLTFALIAWGVGWVKAEEIRAAKASVFKRLRRAKPAPNK